MALSSTFREKVPSALAAIALQVGMLALLALSFEAVRQMGAEKETIFILPPLAVTKPSAPLVIDAREKKKSTPMAAPVPPPSQNIEAAPATPAPPSVQTGIAAHPGPAQVDCVPPGQARPAYRIACPPPAPLAKANPDDDPLPAKNHVRNEQIWQSEIDRRNTPPRVPCVSLTNSTAGMSGFQKEDHGARIDITCALKEWRDPHLLPPVAGTALPDQGPKHASDEDFKKALQAVNARKQALSAKPAQAEKSAAP
jgi:hypothetical protein